MFYMFPYNSTCWALSSLHKMSNDTILHLSFLMQSETNLHLNDQYQVQYCLDRTIL